MVDVCPNCKSSSIVVDDHGGQDHRVCTDCGEVVDSATSFEQERDYWSGVTSCSASGSFEGSNLGKYRSIREGDPNVPKRALRPWLKYVREICGMMKLTAEMERGVVDLFTRAFQSVFKFKQREKKQALCGVVLYIVCRQHDWPVLLSDVGMLVGSSVSDLFAVKTLLESELKIQTTTVDIEEIVQRVLKKYGLEDQDYLERTVKVVVLAKDAWITCGRSHDAAICAAAFLVWKSSARGRGKGNKLPSFFRELRIKPPNQTMRRVMEMRGILMQLLEKLPWFKFKKVTQETATLHLDDILRHKKYLISRVESPKEAEDSEDDGTTQAPETEHTPNQDDASASVHQLSETPTTPILPPSWNLIRKRKLRTYDDDDSEETNGPGKKQSTESWQDGEEISLGEELTDRDIPESELHSYIRSKSEVEALELLQQRVLAEENETTD